MAKYDKDKKEEKTTHEKFFFLFKLCILFSLILFQKQSRQTNERPKWICIYSHLTATFGKGRGQQQQIIKRRRFSIFSWHCRRGKK